MTQSNTMLEMDVPIVQEPQKKRVFVFPKWTKVIAIFAIIAFSGMFFTRCSTDKKESSVNTKALAPLNNNALSQINTEEQTEEYKKNLEQYTQTKIAESTMSGQAFVPPAAAADSKPSLYVVDTEIHTTL